MAFWADGRANYRSQLKAGKRRAGAETTTVRLIRIILIAASRLTSLIDRLLREVAGSFITAFTSPQSRLQSTLPFFFFLFFGFRWKTPTGCESSGMKCETSQRLHAGAGVSWEV